MERSLRATGCDLPLLVMPFDDDLFELPSNAEWWRDESLFNAFAEKHAVAHCRKLAVLSQANCAFFDSDIIHLQNPVKWLEPFPVDVFVVADTEWGKARWTFTAETKALYEARTTLWLLDNFNSGFFAYSNAMATMDTFEKHLSNPAFIKLLHGNEPTRGEQASANLLIHLSGIEVLNICLPPYRMESTMACDYPHDCEALLRKTNSAPFIHYAGPGRNLDAPISRLIFEHLTKAEAAEMMEEFVRRKERARRHAHWPIWVRVAKRIVPRLDQRFCIQWNDS